MIKNIIFDLSEVIASGEKGIEQIIEKNLQIPAEELLKRKKDIFKDTMRGKYTEDEYVKQLLNKDEWAIYREEYKKYIREYLNIPVQGTMEIVKKLKKHYKLILLSDHVQEWIEYILENNKELYIFDKMYFSYELGRLKSDYGTFDLVLKDANIRAEETIFIDDRTDYIYIASLAGIKVIQFKNANELKEDLIKMNVKI